MQQRRRTDCPVREIRLSFVTSVLAVAPLSRSHSSATTRPTIQGLPQAGPRVIRSTTRMCFACTRRTGSSRAASAGTRGRPALGGSHLGTSSPKIVGGTSRRRWPHFRGILRVAPRALEGSAIAAALSEFLVLAIRISRVVRRELGGFRPAQGSREALAVHLALLLLCLAFQLFVARGHAFGVVVVVVVVAASAHATFAVVTSAARASRALGGAALAAASLSGGGTGAALSVPSASALVGSVVQGGADAVAAAAAAASAAAARSRRPLQRHRLQHHGQDVLVVVVVVFHRHDKWDCFCICRFLFAFVPIYHPVVR
jgi:hypothetical protein